jgi:hypothetical protein
MRPLSAGQKQLLFDYCIGLTSESETAQAEALVSSNEQAAQVRDSLRLALDPLESVEIEPCPDELFERTIDRLNEAASSRHRLEELLADEESRGPVMKVRFWHNLSEMAAVAAVIMLVAGVLIPSLSYARHRYWRQRCGIQLGNIFQGIQRYVSDHDGMLPAFANKPGESWWKVGCPGEEPCSSTRPMWRLVTLRYIDDPGYFVCPGRSQGRALRFDVAEAQDYNDFPSRKYITYSPRIPCLESPETCLLGSQPLMSDRSPVFEDLPSYMSREIRLRLDDRLLSANSRNHGGFGQTILFGDGHSTFLKIRIVGASQDDIFTLREMSHGSEVKGCEWPSCETDVFFAP